MREINEGLIEEARNHYSEALAHARRREWDLAGIAAARAWIRAPAEPVIATALLTCAAQACAGKGRAPLRMSGQDQATGLLSFVVCSITPWKLQRLAAELQSRLPPDSFELVHISDARSLAEGYSRGLKRARGDLLVFCHDDIGFLALDLQTTLRRHFCNFDLFGVAGTKKLTAPAWHWAGPPFTASRVAVPQSQDTVLTVLLGTDSNAMTGAEALDGVFLAGKRHVFEQVPFDTEAFDGFHMYDIDQSYRAHRAGFRCGVVLDLPIWHESGGNYGAQWRKYAERFVTKFPELTPSTDCARYRPGTYPAKLTQAGQILEWTNHWLDFSRE